MCNFYETDIKNELMNALWAKSNPYMSLYTHMRESALVSNKILEESSYKEITQLLSRCLDIGKDQVMALVMYLTALHDLGKCHPLFQNKPNSKCNRVFYECHPEINRFHLIKNDYRHEMGSYTAAKRIWAEKNRFDRRTAEYLAATLKLHHQGHGGKNYVLKPNEYDEDKVWVELQDTLEQKIFDWICPPSIEIRKSGHVDVICIMITAIIILCDWISSGETLEDTDQVSDDVIKKRVEEFIKDSDFRSNPLPQIKTIHDVWPWITSESMRPLQREVDKFLSGNKEKPIALILEAPMGEGKTEAGVYAALRMAEYYKKEGFYIGLPTAATSNQMFERINSMIQLLNNGKVRLMHGSSWMYRENSFQIDDRAYAETWTLPSKRSMLASYGVGTVDQVMMSVLKIKYGVLRMLGLSNKVLVIDEVHAYDAYMSKIIQRLLEWCKALEVPVVMLSATLPSAKKKEILHSYVQKNVQSMCYPMITAMYLDGNIEEIGVSGSYQNSTVHVSLLKMYDDFTALAKHAVNQLSNGGGCICVIMNTVDRAQRVYEAIRRIMPQNIMLFHSRFSSGRRREIENECLKLFGKDKSKRPHKFILIATQVIEQSLDLDFDFMISEIAPIDLLLQRIGRLHRHNNTVRPINKCQPKIEILIPEGEGNYGSTEYVYFKFLLNRTVSLLKNRSVIQIPNDIPTLVEACYSEEPDEHELEIFWEKSFSEELAVGKAGLNILNMPSEKSFLLGESTTLFDEEEPCIRASTRLGEDAERLAVLPPQIYEEVLHAEMKKSFPMKLAETCMLYSVNAGSRMLKKIDIREKDYKVGMGKLYGIKLFKASEGADATDTLVAKLVSGDKIILDRNCGLIAERKDCGI